MRWYVDGRNDGRASQGPLPACVPKLYAKGNPSLAADTPHVLSAPYTVWVIGSIVVWSAVTGLVWLYYA